MSPEFYVDGVINGDVCGWGWWPDAPERPAVFVILVDGDAVAEVEALAFRQDLSELGIRNGYAAFVYTLPSRFKDNQAHDIAVLVAGAAQAGFTGRFVVAQEADVTPIRSGLGKVLSGPAETFDSSVLNDRYAADRVLSLAEGLNIYRGACSREPIVTVIITIFNAATDLARCLESVRLWTTLPVVLLLIDDKSTDVDVDVVLSAAFLADRRIFIRKNTENLGYTKSINRGVRESVGDVVVLNSDTIVTPRWLESMLACAHRRQTIGTVTAISNAAGAFSVPIADRTNAYPLARTPEELGRAIGHTSPGWTPAVPTGNGFCMLIKRELIDDIGLFDEEAFPRGYGEENDFCMRALRRGWEHLIDDRTLVLHARSRSFGQNIARSASHKAAALLMERYPIYNYLVYTSFNSATMKLLRSRIGNTLSQLQNQSAMKRCPVNVFPRILYILHDVDDGGTAFTTFDLIEYVQDEFECLILCVKGADICLLRRSNGGLAEVGSWTMDSAPTPFTDQPSYTAIICEILVRFRIELVHIRHLLHHNLSLPSLVSTLNIPTVFSFHDFFAVCPTVTLLDEKGSYCGGDCSPGNGPCPTIMPWPAELPPLKHKLIYDWRRRMSSAILLSDVLVTTSAQARDILLRNLPGLRGKGIQIIEHGRDFIKQFNLCQPPAPSGPVKLLVIGHLSSRHKGGQIVRQLALTDRDELEFHFLGNVPVGFQELGQCHGVYDRENLPTLVGAIQPSFILIPSTWPETYSHTLSEAWWLGVPVICFDLGALGERVRHWGGGWAVEPRDPTAIQRLVKRLRDDTDEYRAVAARARITNIRTAAEMGQDYRALYKTLLAQRVHGATGAAGYAPSCLKVAVVIPDGVAGELAQRVACSRWLVFLRHPRNARRIDGATIPTTAIDRWSSDAGERVLIVPAFGDDQFQVALSRAQAAGLRVICDAGLLPATGAGFSPVYLGAFADQIIEASEPALESQVGLIDERPWLAAADLYAHRCKTACPDTLKRSLLLLVPLLNNEISSFIAQIATEIARDHNRRLVVLSLEPTIAAFEASDCIQIPPRLLGNGDLAGWLAISLPTNISCCFLFTDLGRRLSPAHWGLFGLPCGIAGEVSFAEAATLVLNPSTSSWIDIVRAFEAEPDDAAVRRREAILVRWSLRHRPETYMAWLLGSDTVCTIGPEAEFRQIPAPPLVSNISE